MAENTIDNLSIQVTASAENAARMFDRLASSAGRLRGASRSAAGGMRDMASAAADMGTETREAGEQAGKASPNIRGVGNDAKKAGDNAKKGASGLTTFWNSLKRIAFYRFVRGIIKSVTQAFSEGIKNLYNWSSAVNGTFAKSMDRIATSTLYLKNSLGAMLAPLINALAPVIEWVIDRIVEVINWINKLFAALSGSQTYTVAKKVATTWGDAGKAAVGSAKKAADDIKRTILGFDEINKLEKQNTNTYGGGSGSGNAAMDYTNMFEERRLDGWASKLASFIDKFNLQIPAIFGTLLAGFSAVKLAIAGIKDLSFGWLKDMACKTINIAVSLVRKGWKTIKSWALGFGEAVVNIAVKIKTAAAELWTKFALAWSALNPVLKVGIAISVTASVLWGLYKLAWLLVPNKVLEIQAKFAQTAETLWMGLREGWLNIKSRVLMFSVAIVQTANGLWKALSQDWLNIKSRVLQFSVAIVQTAKNLWEGLKKSWVAIPSRVVQFSVAITQTAKGLWEGLKESWVNISSRVVLFSVSIAQTAQGLWKGLKKGWENISSRVVLFSVSIAQTAQGLWNGLKNSWLAIASRVVQFSVSIAQTAAGLWNGLKQSWNTIQSRVVMFTVSISQTARGLWNGLKNSWNRINSRVVMFSVAITQTAQGLWNGLNNAWDNITSRVLMFSVAITQTAQGLWNGLKGSWNGITSRVLMFSVAITQTAQGLWNGVKSAWEKIPEKIVSFQTQISTTMSSLWEWVKDNWEKVALGALGIAIAIATPWGTIATALSGLWSNVMTYFGGALSFGVLPTFGKVDVQTKMATGNVTPSEIKQYVQDNIAKPMQELLSSEDYEIWIDAHPGRGFKQNNLSRKQAFELDDSIQTGLDQNPLYATVDVKKGWSGSPQRALGVDNMDATVYVDMWTPWWEQRKSALDWLGMSNLKTVVDVSARVSGGGTDKNTKSRQTRAKGGIYSGGIWSNLPQYAGGTYNAHGSLFLAGERGPEIVGHVGGRTEVLNKSQLASAMYSAVTAAMAPAAANFANAASAMSAGNADDSSMNALLDMVRLGGEALARQNSLLAQQNEYLRQINDKDFSADITTASINRANDRNNRRAGITVAPVY